MKAAETNFKCRSCSSNNGEIVLDLGIQPLANNLLNKSDLNKPEPKFPLRLAVCKNCWLMQLFDIVPPLKLFSENLYFSSSSETMVEHFRKATERYIKEFNLNKDSFVIEIASNDGYLLKNFVASKIPCLGIEPAQNLAEVAIKQGVPTVVESFCEQYARKLAAEDKQADIIIANNVFDHVPNINDFVEGLKIALKPMGTVILEFPYGIEMIKKTEFDTIYHDHIFYFTLNSLIPVFAQHGLQVYNVERLPIHGGSLRLFIGIPRNHFISDSVKMLLEEEEQEGIKNLEFYERFSKRVQKLKKELVNLIYDLKSKEKKIAAYGASAKGSTLLNYFQLNKSIIDFIADKSVHKQEKFSPGTHIPIVPAEWLIKRKPDFTLLLAWNFVDEILKEQEKYRKQGGKFIIPVPDIKII
ncbi:MAG TPA: class I SAM-dependent methyltransferase [Verrucomicrobiota bacterium]|nr:class I SAM-dependent methyltransferase [Verrucomicrobiota bacterium]